jgi:hypothetical protein
MLLRFKYQGDLSRSLHKFICKSFYEIFSVIKTAVYSVE